MYKRQVFDLANGTNLAATFRKAAANADPDTIKAAQEAISDDGYWGIKQTSDRMVSMAIALTGGDTDKADEMISAIEKGFKQATKSWGEDLPDICQKTLEAVSYTHLINSPFKNDSHRLERIKVHSAGTPCADNTAC